MAAAQGLFEDVGRKVAETSKEGVSEDEPRVVEEVPDCLCMNCHSENGRTRLLLTKIPFFREVVIMSFECPDCGFKNSEIQPAGEIQQRGTKYTLKVDRAEDLNRQIVKSDTCILRIEDIDLEIPPGRGQLTNVEGILNMISQDLEEKQPERKEAVPEVYEKIEEIVQTIKQMSSAKRLPFTVTVDDPAGNSWIEPLTSDKAGKFTRHDYARSAEQNAALGLAPGTENQDRDGTSIRPEYHATHMLPEMPAAGANNVDEDEDIVERKVYEFPASCPGCMHECTTKMQMVNIPHFQEVVIMSTVCDHCGYRSNEVKTGGEISDKGRRITISISTPEDLTRDILKSESCAMSCPELDLSVEPGTLGGRFTTIEGLLTQVRDDLHATIFDTDDETGGDSMAEEDRQKWNAFFAQMARAITGEVEFTVVLKDPLAGSYVQSLAEDGPDERMKVEDYDRTEEEEEGLGLKDIKTEGYEEPEEEAKDDKRNGVGGAEVDDDVEEARQKIQALAAGKMAPRERERA